MGGRCTNSHQRLLARRPSRLARQADWCTGQKRSKELCAQVAGVVIANQDNSAVPNKYARVATSELERAMGLDLLFKNRIVFPPSIIKYSSEGRHTFIAGYDKVPKEEFVFLIGLNPFTTKNELSILLSRSRSTRYDSYAPLKF